MSFYGILKSSTNTGLEEELSCVFAAPLSITSNQPAFGNDSLTLKRHMLRTNIQRWEIEAGIRPEVTPAEFLVKAAISGHSETFYVRVPQLYRPDYRYEEGVPILAAGVTAGNEALQVTGLMNGFPVGEFIRFQNHTKVYLVTSSTMNAGVNHITISPRLVKNTLTNERVSYGDKVTMPAMFSLDTQLGVRYNDGVLVDVMNVKIVEKL